MIDVTGRSSTCCDGITRRSLLKVGALSALAGLEREQIRAMGKTPRALSNPAPVLRMRFDISTMFGTWRTTCT